MAAEHEVHALITIAFQSIVETGLKGKLISKSMQRRWHRQLNNS